MHCPRVAGAAHALPLCAHESGCVTRLLCAVQAALLQMRAGSVVTLTTLLPFLGHDPTGLVERVPVALRLQVAASLPGQVQHKVFSPPLATQRHTLIREVRPLPFTLPRPTPPPPVQRRMPLWRRRATFSSDRRQASTDAMH